MSARNGSGDTEAETQIRDAACLILVDRSGTEPRLLMGRRRTTQVFLPNKWVFPGGRVDDEDRLLASQLSAQGSSASAHDPELLSFILAAIREMFEEAGVLLDDPHAARLALPATWQQFARSGRMPATQHLAPLARAITPPGQTRRFDTWFFSAERSTVSKRMFEPDGELLDLAWFTLPEVRDLDLPHITRLIVDDVASWLELGAGPEAGSQTARIPFYFQELDSYKRTLIDATGAFLAP
jgi:8-oxo-dGTP pyrophosphatase MutT (NUDIX family)